MAAESPEVVDYGHHLGTLTLSEGASHLIELLHGILQKQDVALVECCQYAAYTDHLGHKPAHTTAAKVLAGEVDEAFASTYLVDIFLSLIDSSYLDVVLHDVFSFLCLNIAVKFFSSNPSAVMTFLDVYGLLYVFICPPTYGGIFSQYEAIDVCEPPEEG